MKFRKIILLFALLNPLGPAHAEEWQEGTVYFNDESTVNGEIRMGTSISFYYDNEEIEVDYKDLKSIELLSVRQGQYVIHQQAYKPITLMDIKLRNGTAVKTEVDTYDKDFCSGKYNFMVRRKNPLTQVVEEKSYSWVGHINATVDSNCLFHDNIGREKEVLKVVFNQ
jgi:hypothetical protein